jgi:hypothetical protein
VKVLAELRKLINAVNYFKPASILEYLKKVAYQTFRLVSGHVPRHFSIEEDHYLLTTILRALSHLNEFNSGFLPIWRFKYALRVFNWGLGRDMRVRTSESPWPMFRHDSQHTGRSPYPGAQEARLKWRLSIGGSTSSPAIGADGTIYVGGYNPYLCAINPNGTLKWEYWTEGAVESSPAIGLDGTIYVGSFDHHLYAINPNGMLKWKYETKDCVRSSPAIGADGTIYVGSDDFHLYAINPDGALKWRYETRTPIRSSPAIGADGTVYIGSEYGHFYAISLNGILKWEYAGFMYRSSPAIGIGSTVCVGSFDIYFYATE